MNKQLHVVVKQRGWVTVGYLSRDGDLIIEDQSRTITLWGTDGMLGLEHLAEAGPTKTTKYTKSKAKDKYHILSPIRMLECTPVAVMAWEKAWK